MTSHRRLQRATTDLDNARDHLKIHVFEIRKHLNSSKQEHNQEFLLSGQ